MNRRKKKAFMHGLGLCFFFFSASLCGQSFHRLSNIHFYQLNTSHGLSDNYVQQLCTDKSGNLWIGTGDGLNMFNGKAVVKFFPQDYPQMQSSNIRQIECDDMNRIWVMTGNGSVTVIDEHRRFHKLGLWDKDGFIPVRRIYQTRSKGIILFTSNAHYTLKPEVDFSNTDSLTVQDFSSFIVKGFEDIQQKSFRQAKPLLNDKVFYSLNEGFYIVDYAAATVSHKHPITDITFLMPWSENEMLAYHTQKLKVCIVNLVTDSITYPFESLRDQFGKPMKGSFHYGQEITPGIFLLTTQRDGIYIYDKKQNRLFNHRHNASDPTTLVNNTPYVVTTDSTGWVFIGATPHGVSYFKSNAVIGQQTIFIDQQGYSYDGYINNIATLDNNQYYISTNNNLMLWNRSLNSTRFLFNPSLQLPFEEAEVNYVAFDDNRRLWASIPRQGICVFNEQNKLISFFNLGAEGKDDATENWVRHMVMGPDGKMWLSTRRGILKADINSFKIVRPDEPPLKELDSTVITQIWFESDDNAWIATPKGAWHYNFKTGQVKIHNTDSGLINNNVFTFNKDSFGNMYIGTATGLDILLTNGKTKRITTKEGLLNGRIEALLLDKKHRMWIGNDVSLACYTMTDSTLKIFDERYGLSVQGFRIYSYHQNSDDELIWGTERGLQYFYPDDIYGQEIKLQTAIHRLESRDVITDLTRNEEVFLSPVNDFITFYFTTIDYSKHLHTFYQYKLEGLDKDWITISDQNSVRYNSIAPGDYVFKVRASNDKKAWVNAENEIVIHKAAHFWGKPWFQFISIGMILAALYALFTALNQKQKRRTEELETEVVINYFASRINTHQSTEKLLWDVAKNCIARLKFEDCVIYMLDEPRQVLVQKAAYGPKSTDDETIHNPIEIPVGQGIVGSVAKKGKPELIRDTTRDPRYIVDDIARQSEIAVPIILDNKIIGVIDSEHSKRNFFTQKHVAILTTISVLCVNQIQRNRAEEEKQQAKIEVLENKQKAAESRLQSLRLQMNPHFLFNALNSIQQMILANEEMVATKYLSRFSKLLRTILIHSDKESISLKEEIDILRLYVELESVRFKDAFTYEIICDDDIDTDEVKIPTLLIQPFVENAIWHGLMHKEGNRRLRIEFTDMNDHVQCIIEDNGIGRQKSAEIKLTSGHDKNHTSKGIKVSVERLNAMQKNGGPRGSMNITDLVDAEGYAAGTRVQINLPIQN